MAKATTDGTPTHIALSGFSFDGVPCRPGELVDLGLVRPDLVGALESSGQVRRLALAEADSARNMVQRAATRRALIDQTKAAAEAQIKAAENEWQANEDRIGELSAALDEHARLVARRDGIAKQLRQARAVVEGSAAQHAPLDAHEALGRSILRALGEVEK